MIFWGFNLSYRERNDGKEETISRTFLEGMREHPAKREILWQRARSSYLQEMRKEIKGATVRRDYHHSHLQCTFVP